MSRLDELIAKFCPNGVKYRELKDILIIKNGKDIRILQKVNILYMAQVEL